MRGVAVLAAATAVWVATGGSVPSIRPRRLRFPTRQVTARAAAAGVGAGAVTLGLAGASAIALAAALLGLSGSLAVEQARESRRHEEAMKRWPDFIVIVRARLAGGASLPDAVLAAGDECGDTLAEMSSRLDEALRGGSHFGSALEQERQNLADPVADRILTSLAIVTEIGGSRVAEVLGALGRSVADETRLRLAHHAAMTQQRLTAGVALVAPWVLLVLTVATNPQAATAYSTPGGQRIILFGLVSTVAGFALARRSARLNRSVRVFR